MSMDKKNIENILHKGLEGIINQEEFRVRAIEIQERAFEKIIDDAYNGLIQWGRSLETNEEQYTTEVVVENALGEKIAVPVLFYTTYDSEGNKDGYLYLGDKDGLLLGNSWQRPRGQTLRRLARNVFGIQGLPGHTYFTRTQLYGGFECMACGGSRGINPLDLEQLKNFPFRLSIQKRSTPLSLIGRLLRKFSKSFHFSGRTYSDFQSLSSQFLKISDEASFHKAKYAVLLDGNSPDSDEVPENKFFVYDCLTHTAPKVSESLSLRDITEDTFRDSSHIHVSVRALDNGNRFYNTAILEYIKEKNDRFFIYAEGEHDFKINLSQGFSKLSLPGFTFGTGYEFTS